MCDMSHTCLLRPGQRLGSFVVVRFIGSGGYSEVYEVETADGEKAALKAARMHDVDDALASRRQLLEALVLGELAHPNVVKYLASGTTADAISWTAMELVAGESLHDLLERTGRLELDRAMRLAVQLAAGLGHAHELGTVHRDVKPANLLISGVGQTERLKVIDFGIAKLECMPLYTTEIIGTPLYMAPDYLLARNPTKGDPRWDVYAAAVVVYEMLAGRHPLLLDDELGAPPVSVVVTRHLRHPIVPLGAEHGCPAEVWAILERGLARNPGERFANGKELESALSSAWRKLRMQRDGITPGEGPLFGDARGARTKKAVREAVEEALASVRGAREPRSELDQRRLGELSPSDLGLDAAPLPGEGSRAPLSRRQGAGEVAAAAQAGIPQAPPPSQRHASLGRSVASAQVSLALPARDERHGESLSHDALGKVQIRPEALGTTAEGELLVRLPASDPRAATRKGLGRGANDVLELVGTAPPSSRGSLQNAEAQAALQGAAAERAMPAYPVPASWRDVGPNHLGHYQGRPVIVPWRAVGAGTEAELEVSGDAEGQPTFRPSMVDGVEAAGARTRRTPFGWLAVAGVISGASLVAVVRTTSSALRGGHATTGTVTAEGSVATAQGSVATAQGSGLGAPPAAPSMRLRSESAEPVVTAEPPAGEGERAAPAASASAEAAEKNTPGSGHGSRPRPGRLP